ncbi:MAG: sulfatase [Anaerolineae bacterium]|nr:sulfatase [Thermoflexales bacterium]MDW8408760.1 sulfatase [Anaerolineae bacterium]
MKTRRPDILLLVLDTLRADRLRCYGSPQSILPAVDALAEESTVFRFAIAPAQWSIPSHASLFTGVYPSVHDTTQSNSILPEGLSTLAERLRAGGYYTAAFCNNPLVGVINNGLRRGFESFLNYAGLWPSRPNQAGARPGAYDRLRQQFKGWLTELITGIQDAFARSDFLLEMSLTPLFVPLWQTALSFKGNSRKSLDDAARLLIRRSGLDSHQPIFAFINLMGIHMPYRAPRPYVERFAPQVLHDPAARRFLRQFNTDAFGWLAPLTDPVSEERKAVLEGMYNAEAACQDEHVGAFFERLRQAGRLDSTLVIVLSDHGDHLGEHQLMGHSVSLYNELVRVPLIVRDRSGAFPAGAAVDHFVSTRRVFHTALAAAGLADEEEHRLTLAGDVDGRPEQGTAFSESIPALNFLRMVQKRRPELIQRYAIDQYRVAVCQDGHKLIQVGSERVELYDVVHDPTEQHDLSLSQPERVERMRRLITDFAQQASAAGQTAHHAPQAPDPLLAQRLRSLGYLD